MSERRKLIIETCARAAHEANRAYCAAVGQGDKSSWDDLPADVQASAREGVLRALGGATPEQLQESWYKSRVAAGWTHGPKLDAEQKTHPCLVPYAQLSAADKAKDALFQGVVVATRDALFAALPPVPEPVAATESAPPSSR